MTELKLSNIAEVLLKFPPVKVVVSEYLDINALLERRDSVVFTREDLMLLREFSAQILEPNTEMLRRIIHKIMFTCDNGLMGKIYTEEMLNYSFVSAMGNVIHVQVLNPAVLEDRTPYQVFSALL